jgi:hypothetical protein
MQDYIYIHKSPEIISLCFYLELSKPMNIGDKMNVVYEKAYMNGPNWEAFFNHYLSKNHPALLQGMDTDSEAGMYYAIYNFSLLNIRKVEEFAVIIEDLIENENKIYAFLKSEGKNIQWD